MCVKNKCVKWELFLVLITKLWKIESKQRLTMEEALNGHNLLILGQSGTGKSYLVGEIEKNLKRKGKSI